MACMRLSKRVTTGFNPIIMVTKETCCKYCVHMYVNGKRRPVETIPGVGA
jgi:hypothetical protein